MHTRTKFSEMTHGETFILMGRITEGFGYAQLAKAILAEKRVLLLRKTGCDSIQICSTGFGINGLADLDALSFMMVDA